MNKHEQTSNIIIRESGVDSSYKIQFVLFFFKYDILKANQ